MYDKELVLEVLEQILTASQTIMDRFKPIKRLSDFTDSPGGREGLRDIILHQYFDVNAEAIFDVCETKIQPLADTIATIIEDIK